MALKHPSPAKYKVNYSFLLHHIRPINFIKSSQLKKSYGSYFALGGLAKEIMAGVWLARLKNWGKQQRVLKFKYLIEPHATYRDSENRNIIDYWELPCFRSTARVSFEAIAEFDGSEPEPPNRFVEKRFNTFIRSEPYIEVNGEIRRLARKLSHHHHYHTHTAEALFSWMVENIKYRYPTPGWSAKQTLQSRQGDCGGISLLFVALCRSARIPSRIVSGAWTIPGSEGPHMWCEFYSEKKGWLPVDCSRSILLTNSRRHRRIASSINLPKDPSFYFGQLDNNRIVFSKGSNINLSPQKPFPKTYPYMKHGKTLFMQPTSVYPFISGPLKGFYEYDMKHRVRVRCFKK
jgi:hypothetical protein